jgi:hypothetical protein
LKERSTFGEIGENSPFDDELEASRLNLKTVQQMKSEVGRLKVLKLRTLPHNLS